MYEVWWVEWKALVEIHEGALIATNTGYNNSSFIHTGWVQVLVACSRDCIRAVCTMYNKLNKKALVEINEGSLNYNQYQLQNKQN